MDSAPSSAGPVRTTSSIKRRRIGGYNSYFTRTPTTADSGRPDTRMTDVTQQTKSRYVVRDQDKKKRSRVYFDRFKIGADQSTDPVYPRPEVKYWDQLIPASGSPPVNVLSTGTIQNLSNITLNITNGRISTQCSLKSVYYQFVAQGGTANVPALLRHIVLYDRQPSQSIATAAAILQDPTLPITSPLNIDYSSRFVILADDRIQLSPRGSYISFCKGYRKVNQTITWAGSGTTSLTGMITVALFSTTTVATDAPNIYGVWRLRFIDN